MRAVGRRVTPAARVRRGAILVCERGTCGLVSKPAHVIGYDRFFPGSSELRRFAQMASLAHVIRDFQSGGLSRGGFVAQLRSTLATGGVRSPRLLENLGEAHTRNPPPPGLDAEGRRRIEQPSS